MIIEIEQIGKRVEVPDSFAELSEEEQNRYVQNIIIEYQRSGQPQIEESLKEEIVDEARDEGLLSIAGDTARSVVQGLTFGFGEELEAAAKTGFGLIGDYDKEVKKLRKDIEDFQKTNPSLAIGGELVGGLATLLIPGVGLAGAATRVAGGTGQAVLRSAGTGAGYGAAYGAGTAEGGIGERLTGAATGATVGGALGAATPLAGRLASSGVSRVADALGVRGVKRAEQFADQKILQALEREGLTPDEAVVKLQRARDLGQEDILIADLGESMRGLGYSAQAIPQRAKTKVAEKLEERQLEQAERITDDLTSRAKLEGPFSIKYLDNLTEAQEKLSEPFYKKAYQKNLPAKAFKEFFTGPKATIMQKASKDAKELLAAEGREIPDISKIMKDETQLKKFLDGNLPTEYLHSLKRGLDSLIDSQVDNLTGRATKKGVAYINLKNDFNKIIGSLNPAYKEANAKFSDYARLKQAYEVGYKAKNKSSDLLNKFLSKFNDGEKEAFKVGFIANVKDRAESTADARDFTKVIFGSKKNKDLIRKAFPSGKDGAKQYKEFEQVINLEKEKILTRRRVSQLSPTEERRLAVQEAGADPAEMASLMAQLGRGDVLGTAQKLMGSVGARIGGLNPQSAENIARKLFLQSPDEQIAYLKTLNEVDAELVQKILQRIRREQTASALLGQQAGIRLE